jgi:hypothetical protein
MIARTSASSPSVRPVRFFAIAAGILSTHGVPERSSMSQVSRAISPFRMPVRKPHTLEEAATNVIHRERGEVWDKMLRQERGRLARRDVEGPPQGVDLAVHRGRRLPRVSAGAEWKRGRLAIIVAIPLDSPLKGGVLGP